MQLGLPFLRDETSVPVEPAAVQFFFVRHRRARRYMLRVEPDGRVRVTIPRGGSQREAALFAGRHQVWIATQRATLTGRTGLSTDERRALMARACEELPERLRTLAEAHDLTVTRVSIRNQRSRWGSCGRDGHVSLNWRLLRMPDWVRDYVMIHELMHLQQMNHSPSYWKLVASACPEYNAARQWLRTHGRGL